MKRIVRRRVGISLLELLVAIAIIGVLVGVLLVAVQKVRASADRAKCQNNLKQIGLAAHGYAAAARELPPGSILDLKVARLTAGSRTHVGWTVLLLPHLDQGPLSDQIMAAQRDNGPGLPRYEYCDAKILQPFVQQPVPAYTCPNDPQKGKVLLPEFHHPKFDDRTFATGSYRAMAGRADGSDLEWSTRHAVDDPADAGAGLPPRDWRGPVHATGRGIGLGGETLAGIRDGTSNTILAGEYYTTTDPARTTLWAFSMVAYTMSSATAGVPAALGADYEGCRAKGGGNACKRGWGGLHPGVINFVFCDGAVRGLRADIDTEAVFPAYGTIAGGEAVPE